MKYKFFKKNIEPACEVCEISVKTESNMAIYCKHNGLVEATFSCRRFRYDPLKRVPRRPNLLPEYDEKDFEL